MKIRYGKNTNYDFNLIEVMWNKNTISLGYDLAQWSMLFSIHWVCYTGLYAIKHRSFDLVFKFLCFIFNYEKSA